MRIIEFSIVNDSKKYEVEVIDYMIIGTIVHIIVYKESVVKLPTTETVRIGLYTYGINVYNVDTVTLKSKL